MEKIYKNKTIIYILFIIFILVIIYLLYFIYKRYKYEIYKKSVIDKFIYGKNIETFISSLENENLNHSEENKEDTLKNDFINYQLYKNNKFDSYNFLVRDLLVHNILSLNEDNIHIYEHMDNQNIDDLFPDMNKNSFGLNEEDDTNRLLEKKEYVPEKTQISSNLLNMDTRPSEQKNLDNLLNDLNIYLYLLKQRIQTLLYSNKDVLQNQKIILYYSLFTDTKKSSEQVYKTYNENKLTPTYSVDEILDTKANNFLDNKNGIANKFISIYKDFQTSNDKNKFNTALESIFIPTPKEIGSEDEDEIQDPFTVLREFADNVKNFYESLNTVIGPYYNYILELNLIPYPRDYDSQDPDSPDNKTAAALMASYAPEMLALSSSYNDIMVNYILNEDIYLLLNLTNNNLNKFDVLQSLPNISQTNLNTIKSLIKNKIITSEQISSFDKSIINITTIYDYFKSLDNIILSSDSPENIDIELIENIIKGNVLFNLDEDDNQKYKLFKKNDPLPDDDLYIFALKNTINNNELIFKSLVDGFTTDKDIPNAPNKNSIKKAQSKIRQQISNITNRISQTLTKTTDTIAKGSTEVAQDIAKGSTEVAQDIAKGSTEVAQDIAKGTTQAAQDIAKGTTQAAQDIAKGTTQVATQAAQGVRNTGKAISKFLK
jgi:hypothetical protein